MCDKDTVAVMRKISIKTSSKFYIFSFFNQKNILYLCSFQNIEQWGWNKETEGWWMSSNYIHIKGLFMWRAGKEFFRLASESVCFHAKWEYTILFSSRKMPECQSDECQGWQGRGLGIIELITPGTGTGCKKKIIEVSIILLSYYFLEMNAKRIRGK